MVLFYFILSLHLWAAGPQCGDLFLESKNIAEQADLISKDLLQKTGKLTNSAEVIRHNLEVAKQELSQRQLELLEDIKDPGSIYRNTDYKVEDILKAIESMKQGADVLIKSPGLTNAEYVTYFYRLSAVLSFMKTSEVKSIYDGLSDYLGKKDPNYNIYDFVRENFDAFADLALRGRIDNQSDLQSILSSSNVQMNFIYEMPSLSLLTEKMAKGVVYATISNRPSTFDGGPLLFPFDLAKHDLAHAARFAAALHTKGISIEKFTQDNESILRQVKASVSTSAYQFFLIMHFSRNHEGAYELMYILPDGRFSWLGIKDTEIRAQLEINPPEQRYNSKTMNQKHIETLRRKGFL